MKKLILLLSLIAFCASPSFAACSCPELCPQKPYDLSSKAEQILTNGTGVTFLAQQVAQGIIKKELKKATKESFKVKMKSFSAGDLAGGRFKSLEISGKNLDIDGVYLTSLNLKTLCDFNYIDLSNKKQIKFKENMLMGYEATISDSDLRKTMKSSGYMDMLNSVQLSGMGITFFKLSGADVRIKNNKLYFTVQVTSQLLKNKPMDVVVAADLKVEEGRIVVTKVDFVNLFTRIDLSKITYLLNAINPLTFSMDVLQNKNTQMKVQTVNIIGDKINVGGFVFIPKNYTKPAVK